jgi:predicted transcriptional regulator
MIRYIPQTSLDAYHDPTDKAKRISLQELIKDFFAMNPSQDFTIREVSEAIKVPYSSVQKRISDLDGINIKRHRTRLENNRENGTYIFYTGEPIIKENFKDKALKWVESKLGIEGRKELEAL